MIMIFKRERKEKHCCKDCVKKHASCPIAREIAIYAVSCIHKIANTQSESTVNPTK